MGLTFKSNKQGMCACAVVRDCCPLSGMVLLVNKASGTVVAGETGENLTTGVFSEVLLKGDVTVGYNGAINGMSIVNCCENELPSPEESFTLSVGSLLFDNAQQMQYPQVKHLGNKLCEYLLAFTTSFVTIIGKCTLGDRHPTVGDLLVNRSGVDSTVGDLSSVRLAKAGDGGLWVWSWLAGVIASTPGS